MEESLLILQVPCDFTKYESQSKNKMKLTFVTQENIPKELQARIITHHEQFGWLAFLAGEKRIEAENVLNLPNIDKQPEEKLSPAQLLKNVLYRVWEHAGKPTQTSEEYYRMEMEKITRHYKEKLT